MHGAFRCPHHMAAKHLCQMNHPAVAKYMQKRAADASLQRLLVRSSDAHLADALVAHAHPKQWYLRPQLLHNLQRDP